MANQITDGRTNLFDGSVSPVSLSGATAGTADTEIFYSGTTSYGLYSGSVQDGLMYDAGSVQAGWANSHFYITLNCGIVGLLETKALNGTTIRFCGATVTNWFEVYVGGKDSWPSAFEGGWVTFVVDIETARSTAVTNGWTNGTVPTTAQCQYVGFSTQTVTMPRMADNTWLDSIDVLADGTSGILIEGRNAGTTDWNWVDVISQSDSGKWATSRSGPGGSVVLNTPVQFFVDDASTHAFTDTNKVILWDDQEFIAADFYGFTQLGAATGTSNLNAGVKSGTGNDATGSQGWTIVGSGLGRWFLDVNAANIDSSNWYGCSFQHGATMGIDNTTTSVISTTFSDCTSCTLANVADFIGNIVVNANTADGVAFAIANSISDIVNSSFIFSDGHAIEITTPGTYTWVGNTHTGYGIDTSTDAVVYNNSGGLVTINFSTGNIPTYRNGAGASTVVSATFTLSLTDIPTGVNVTIVNSSTRAELQHSTSTGADITYSHTGTGTIDILLNSLAYDPNLSDVYDLVLDSSNSSIKFQVLDDINYDAGSV